MNKLALSTLLCVLWSPVLLAETHSLSEPVSDERVFLVENRLEVTGKLETTIGGGKSATLELDVAARFQYRERRLPGNGRDAEALRALRSFERAEAEIEVAEQTTSSRLRPGRTLLVAEGRREGIRVFSPDGPLTFAEVELLQLPGDSLAVLGLLPPAPVEVGQDWKPEGWVLQTLTNTEAVVKSELTCRLDRIRGDVAEVSFIGRIGGATEGAVTTITLSGRYEYDVRRRFIMRVELMQKEQRAVGAVSPGMDVTARAVVTRRLADSPGPLTDAAARSVPLEPQPESYRLGFQSPWNVTFEYERGWHIFHQSAQVAVLRLLDHGSLIAQCNVTKIPAAPAGRHTSPEQFQADIQSSLGESLKSITAAEPLLSRDGRYLFRVTAEGKANDVEMVWIYYLVADASGRQLSFVFAVEKDLQEKLAGRDRDIISSVEFLTPPKRPTAAKRE